MTETPDILAIGEPLIEFVRLGDRIDGRPVYRQGFGGDTSNAMIAAARQGARAGYITAVGGDPFGAALLDLWRDEGVDTANVLVRQQDPTGVYFVDPDPAGRRFSYARRGSAASLYTADELPVAAIEAAKILHVSALSQAISPSMRATVRRACEIAKSAGVLVSFDTNLRLNLWTLDEARHAIFDLLPLADIVLPSDDEAAQLLGTGDEAEMIERFAAGGAGIVILKRGERGPRVRVGEAETDIAVPHVDALDSTGAGDSFAGAFLAYFLETGDALRAADLAARVAAITVTGYGAVDPIPYRAAVI